LSHNHYNHLLVQGRGLKQIKKDIQYFPINWEEEFPIIEKLGFDGIEWIYDDPVEYENPLLNSDGRKKMIDLSKQNSVKLENIVFDWFLRHPLFVDNDGVSLESKIKHMKKLIKFSSITGFQNIIFPILEKNNINSPQKFNKCVKIFKDYILDDLTEFNIQIHFETSLTSQIEKKLLNELNHDKLKICFDMGNSASYGYDCEKSISDVMEFLGSVHIKDRVLGGPSVPLNDGVVNFKKVFKSLNQIKFSGPLSYQIYRNMQTDNLSLLKQSLIFINDIIYDVTNDRN